MHPKPQAPRSRIRECAVWRLPSIGSPIPPWQGLAAVEGRCAILVEQIRLCRLHLKRPFGLTHLPPDIQYRPGAVAEWADAGDLKSSEGNLVWVRLPPAPPRGSVPAIRAGSNVDCPPWAARARSEAEMPNRLTLITLTLGAGLIGACTLPGAASPTPFTFPTPNLTLTAVFASVATAVPPPASTLPPLPSPTASPSPLLPPENTPPQATPAATIATAAASTGSRPNGTLVAAEFLTNPPAIDGSLDEWDTTAYTANHVVFGSSAWSGTNDLSATYHIGWDQTFLYVGVKVVDDRFVQVAQGRSLFKGDEGEIQVG